jgi:hypothetical protein
MNFQVFSRAPRKNWPLATNRYRLLVFCHSSLNGFITALAALNRQIVTRQSAGWPSGARLLAKDVDTGLPPMVFIDATSGFTLRF